MFLKELRKILVRLYFVIQKFLIRREDAEGILGCIVMFV